MAAADRVAGAGLPCLPGGPLRGPSGAPARAGAGGSASRLGRRFDVLEYQVKPLAQSEQRFAHPPAAATRRDRRDGILTMLKQRTLKSAIKATGVGLHTGVRVDLGLRPAAPDTGIVFHRTDLAAVPAVPARADFVGDTRLSSTLKRGAASVSTVEHLMSALAGLGVDNLHVDVAGPEVPIMDGSAGPFVFLLQSAGIVEQEAPKRYVRIVAPVEVRDGDKWARFDPFEGFRLDFTIDFPHPVFGSENRQVAIDFAEHSYVKEVARARTFGFMQDVEAMRAAGLGLGGSLQNAIVLDEFKVLNSDGLRYDNEFVRHKILDAIGDLYLLGHPLIGQYTAYKSGHGLNNALARSLLASPLAFEIVTYAQEGEVPAAFQDWQFAPA